MFPLFKQSSLGSFVTSARHLSKAASPAKHLSKAASPSSTTPPPHQFSLSEVRVFYLHDKFEELIPTAFGRTLSAVKTNIKSPKIYCSVFTGFGKDTSVKKEVEAWQQMHKDIRVVDVVVPLQKGGPLTVPNRMKLGINNLMDEAESSKIKPTVLLMIEDPENNFKGIIHQLSKRFRVTDDHKKLILNSHHYWVWGGKAEGVQKSWTSKATKWDATTGIWK